VVLAAGPFTDSFLAGSAPPRLRPTLGVHLVLDAGRAPHDGRALVLRTPHDNRLFFYLPAGARTIVGTTDTDWSPAQSPGRAPRLGDEIRARASDVAYLLEALNHALPSLGIGPADVLSTYAGLRPLLATSAHSPSETSREHDIARGPDGTLTVVGGKLTTLRRMAEQTVDATVGLLHASGSETRIGPCETGDRLLPGGGPVPDLGPALPEDVRRRLADAYGSRGAQLTALITAQPALATRIDAQLPYIWAEVVQAVRAEHARDVEDVLRRRVPLFRDARDQGLAAAERTAAILAAELGWDDAHRDRAAARYRTAVAASRRWRDE
jgi:glycerol-3-phosphate dehydrogenase